MPSAPETRYAKSGDLNIAYQVAGEDSLDLIYLPGLDLERRGELGRAWAPSPEGSEGRARGAGAQLVPQDGLDRLAPSEDDAFKNRLATYFRRSASPGAAVALMRMNTQLDVREVLPWIQAPTLVLHRKDDLDVNVAESRWIAQQIPGAKFIELAGDAHTI